MRLVATANAGSDEFAESGSVEKVIPVRPPTTTIAPTPVLILSPSSGRAGTLVTATGNSFNTFGEEFPQAVITFDGGRVVPDIVWITDGGFTTSFTVPAGTPPGTYAVRASGPLNAAAATFSVVSPNTTTPTPTPPPNPPSPPTLILYPTVTPQSYLVTVDGTVAASAGTTITRVSWDWGDGTIEDRDVPNTHTYGANGPYTVTAYQSDGQSSIRPLTVTVGGPTLTSTMSVTPTTLPATATVTATTVPPTATVTTVTVTVTPTGVPPPPGFPWWLVAIVAVGLLAGGVAIVKGMSRRPPTPEERVPGLTIEARGGMRRPNSAGPPRRREAEVEIEVRGGMRRER